MSGLLTADDLAFMRGIANGAMAGTAQYTVTTRTKNNKGGSTVAEVPFSTPCLLTRKEQYTTTPDVASGRLIEAQVWDIALPHGTPVPTTETVIVNGQRFRVIANNSAESYSTMVHLLAVQGD